MRRMRRRRRMRMRTRKKRAKTGARRGSGGAGLGGGVPLPPRPGRLPLRELLAGSRAASRGWQAGWPASPEVDRDGAGGWQRPCGWHPRSGLLVGLIGQRPWGGQGEQCRPLSHLRRRGRAQSGGAPRGRGELLARGCGRVEERGEGAEPQGGGSASAPCLSVAGDGRRLSLSAAGDGRRARLRGDRPWSCGDARGERFREGASARPSAAEPGIACRDDMAGGDHPLGRSGGDVPSFFAWSPERSLSWIGRTHALSSPLSWGRVRLWAFGRLWPGAGASPA